METTTSSSPPWASFRIHSGSAFASLASPSTSPVAPRTVWGTTAVPPTVSPTLPSTVVEHEPSDHDGWLQNWEQDLLGENDLVARFEGTSISSNADSRIGATGTSNKRKKNKKITLMTTNERMGAWTRLNSIKVSRCSSRLGRLSECEGWGPSGEVFYMKVDNLETLYVLACRLAAVAWQMTGRLLYHLMALVCLLRSN